MQTYGVGPAFIENLLHFGRRGSDRVSNDRQPFDLSSLAVRTVFERSGVDGTNRVLVKVRAQQGVALVFGDEQRTERVMTSLVSDALTSAESGTLVVVEVAPRDGQVEVTVRASGPEPSQQEQARALRICRSIIEAQGGRMWVETEPGLRSRRCFTLPAAQTVG